MPRVEIKGGKTLQGTVNIHGSKNATLPILAASVLFDNETITLDNVPDILDVKYMRDVLEQIGVHIEIDGDTFVIKTAKLDKIVSEPSESLLSRMRATVLLLGGLLAATGRAEIALPGGCSIGYRPVDMHISALEAMGASIELEHGILMATAPSGLNAAEIALDSPSVGATENIIMAAVLTEGETVIENASREPEVVDFIRFLKDAGANIVGAGTSTIKIIGVERLHGVRHEIIPDRIEVATYMVAAAITGGDITIYNAIPDHLETFTRKLREIGVEVDIDGDVIRVKGKDKYLPESPIDIRTAPYPGFHTDMQVLILPLLLKVSGGSMLIDNVFDQRFRHVAEFARIGAEIKQIDNMLIINQKQSLHSGKVEATDVRAAASLVLVGLSADIELEVEEMRHLIRGYEGLLQGLQALGAEITITDYNGYEGYKW